LSFDRFGDLLSERGGGTFCHPNRLPCFGIKHMTNTDVRALRGERASQSSGGAWRESDDGFDFPPTAHPGRELFTASLFVLLSLTLLLWGGWKLISLM
jgi:hypothetical protein